MMTDFIIVGNINVITYKQVFPLIKEGKIRVGGTFNKTLDFETPSGLKSMVGISWYSSYKVKRPALVLTKSYSPDKYPKYDNYDAIEVSRVKDIPYDYDGVMGVPITFLDKYCPEQFEIIGGFNGYKESDEVNGLICGTQTEYIDKGGKIKIWNGPTINKKTCYFRILIRKKKEEEL